MSCRTLRRRWQCDQTHVSPLEDARGKLSSCHWRKAGPKIKASRIAKLVQTLVYPSFGASFFQNRFHVFRNLAHFGFSEDVIAERVSGLVEEVRKEGVESLRGEFRDLNDFVAGE